MLPPNKRFFLPLGVTLLSFRTTYTEAVIDYSTPLTAYTGALQLWTSSGTSDDYAYGYQNLCRCPSEMQMEYWIRVQSDVVTAVRDRFGSEQSTSAATQTIDGLFDMISTAIDESAFQIDVEYDEEYGYPKMIFIDYVELVADEEFRASVDSFAPNGEWQAQLNNATAIWQSKGAINYTYVFNQLTMMGGNPQLVYVSQDAVVSVNGTEVGEASEVLTVNDLLNEIQSGIDSSAFSIRADYDSNMGYPVDISINYIERLADEEKYFFASNLEILSTDSEGDDDDDDDDDDDEIETSGGSAAVRLALAGALALVGTALATS